MLRTPLSPAPLVYAHRGDRSRAPDNTLEAFSLAVEAGAHGIELDVRPTADGELIVSHDDRSPDLPPYIEMTLSEIKKRVPTVPTFIETLEFIPQHVWINAEIKNFPMEADFDPTRDKVDATIETITRYDSLERILLSSFDPIAMQRANEISPALLRSQLIRVPTELEVGIGWAVDHGAQAINPQIAYLAEDPTAVVSAVHDAGLRIVVWGVDAPDDVTTLVNAGVDAIITDDPTMARHTIDQL